MTARAQAEIMAIANYGRGGFILGNQGIRDSYEWNYGIENTWYFVLTDTPSHKAPS